MNERIDKKIILTRLQDRFIELINEHIDSGLSESQKDLAEKVGVHKTHLNNMLKGIRTLTAYNLFPFIQKGIIKVRDIYDEAAADQKEKDYWDRVSNIGSYGVLTALDRLKKKKKFSDDDIEEIVNMLGDTSDDMDIKTMLVSVKKK